MDAIKETGYDTPGDKLKKAVRRGFLAVENRSEKQTAKEISREAMEFASVNLGFAPIEFKVKSMEEHSLIMPGHRPDGKPNFSVTVNPPYGRWDRSTNTIYLDFSKNKDKQRHAAVHETGHAVADQLWISADDLQSVQNGGKDPVGLGKAVDELFELDFRKLSPSASSEERDGTLREKMVFGKLEIERDIYHSKLFGTTSRSFSIYRDGQALHGLARDTKNPEELDSIINELGNIPGPAFTVTKHLLETLYNYGRNDRQKADLEALNEGWVEFFSYTFLKRKGIISSPEQLRPRNTTSRDTRLGDSSIDYQLGVAHNRGFYLMVDFAEKIGNDIAALKLGLGATSIQDLQDIINSKQRSPKRL